MTLHLYFARRFAASLLMVFGVFLVLSLLIDMLEQIRAFGGGRAALADIVALTLFNVPAAGRSALRSLTAPLVVALAAGTLAVGVLNPIVAATSKEYERLGDRLRGGAGSLLSISAEGLWLREGGLGNAGGSLGEDAVQRVIRATRASLDGTELHGVTFLTFDADGVPLQRIEAGTAALGEGAWSLSGVKLWTLSAANPEREAQALDRLDLPSTLTRDQIRDSFGQPFAVAIWDLPGFIADLDTAGFSARAHRVWFQMEIAQPVLFAAMLLLGAAFTLRPQRGGRTGVMVLSAILAGFAVFFLRDFARLLGETGQIPVALAAWSIPVAALLIAIALILHQEDG
ncbi:MAG: LptF/LptG family permease [Rhodobacteraceae bacterium]|nr:LptF/LptG family permease [Paracoccaceae bacterium]